MGSSGDDYSVPPQQPAPPGGMISPFGQSTPDPGWQGINFLDNNTATGITPAMDAKIRAMSAPPGGAMGPPGGGGGMPPAAAGPGGMTPDERAGLAMLMAASKPTPRWAEGSPDHDRGGGRGGPGSNRGPFG